MSKDYFNIEISKHTKRYLAALSAFDVTIYTIDYDELIPYQNGVSTFNACNYPCVGIFIHLIEHMKDLTWKEFVLYLITKDLNENSLNMINQLIDSKLINSIFEKLKDSYAIDDDTQKYAQILNYLLEKQVLLKCLSLSINQVKYLLPRRLKHE